LMKFRKKLLSNGDMLDMVSLREERHLNFKGGRR